jgi:hypothetical protein
VQIQAKGWQSRPGKVLVSGQIKICKAKYISGGNLMEKVLSLLVRFSVLLSAAVLMYGCSGGGGSSAPQVSGTWYAADAPNTSSAQIAALFDAGQLYFNVASAANSSGEIRGQITPSPVSYLTDNGSPFAANPSNSPVTFAALLSGDQVRPRNVITLAKGYGSVTLDPVSKQLTGFLVSTGISGTAARLNDGLLGSSGSTLLTLEGGPVVWTVPAGTVLNDQQISRLNAGAIYFEVQSDAFPAGEIRGQLDQQVRFASLKGANEVPPVASSGSGIGVLGVNPATNRFTGFVKLGGISSTVTQVAVRVGAAGVVGSPVITMTSNGNGIYSVPPNTVLSTGNVTSFNNNDLYFNVNTQANPTGELRGQILKGDIRLGTASLSGAKEVPAVVSPASGIGAVLLNSITEQVLASVKTLGLTGTASRLHSGSSSANGPVLVTLDSSSPVIAAPVGGVSFSLDVQPVFTANCTFSCHVTGGIAPLSLQSGLAYNNILTRVVPGSSSTSYLIDRLTGAVPPRMPLILPPLDTNTINTFRSWIDAGALDN